MGDKEPVVGVAETEIVPQPRFLQAIMATESFLKNATQEERDSYFSNKSNLAQKAQSFDILVDGTVVLQGDPTNTIISMALELSDTIGDYRGPTGVADIYKDLYTEPIKEVLGE